MGHHDLRCIARVDEELLRLLDLVDDVDDDDRLEPLIELRRRVLAATESETA